MVKSLGKMFPKVSDIGLGMAGLGGSFFHPQAGIQGYGDIDHETAIEVIKLAIDNGISLFNVADIFGAGKAEQRLGEVLSEYRDNVIIAGSFGLKFNEKAEIIGSISNSEDIRSALERSLKNLRTDYIDIYQLQIPQIGDFELLNVIFSTLEDLVNENKIKSFGAASNNMDLVKTLSESKFCSAFQYRYNLIDKDENMYEFCKSNNIGSMANGVLANGVFTKKYLEGFKPKSDHVLSTRDLASPQYQKVIDYARKVNEVIGNYDYSLPEFAISWIIQFKQSMIPLVGAKNKKQIIENVKVLSNPIPKNTLESIIKEIEMPSS